MTTTTLDQYIEDLREANKEADLHKLSLLEPAQLYKESTLNKMLAQKK